MIKRTYPELPILSAGAIIFRDTSVLLIKRGKEPAKGLWSVPGGIVQIGERICDGLMREVREEAGIAVVVQNLVEIVERIFADDGNRIKYHYVILDYLCEYTDGQIQAGSDADDAVFVSLDAIGSYQLTAGLAEIIDKAYMMRNSI